MRRQNTQPSPVKSLAPVFLVLALLLTLSGTLAYYVSEQTARGLVSTSGVSIALSELSPSASGLTPFSDLTEITPGVSYSKIPVVKNDGPEPVWLRVRPSLVRIYTDPVSGEEITEEISDFTSLFSLSDQPSSWTFAPDSFYYYSTPLSPDTTSDPLFHSISFSDTLPALYPGTTFAFKLTAEATQSKNNGTSPTTAIWTEEGE